MSDVFISYSHNDGLDFVKQLAIHLTDVGYDIWYDKNKQRNNIHPGALWRRAILKAIFRCKVFIVVFSKKALKSPWVNFECNIALSLKKPILPVLIDIPAEKIPKYLLERQVVDHKQKFTKTSKKIVKAIQKLCPYPKNNYFWYDLFKKGIDIYIPLEHFYKEQIDAKHTDKKKQKVDGVNISSTQSALYLQEKLLKRYLPHLHNHRPIKIQDIDAKGRGFSDHRNRIIIGGPGGVPYVHNLLKNWSGFETDEGFSGYRYVVREDLVSEGPFLRASAKENHYIEDVKAGDVLNTYEVVRSEDFKTGVNYGILYTHGFDPNDHSQIKTIILSAFNRSVLKGMIHFLMDDRVRSRWIVDASSCGEYSETLISFQLRDGFMQHSEDYSPRPLQVANA